MTGSISVGSAKTTCDGHFCIQRKGFSIYRNAAMQALSSNEMMERKIRRESVGRLLSW